MNFLSFLQVSQAAAGSSQGSFMMTIVTFGLVFVIFYFFIIRPQNKKQKETEKMISALKKATRLSPSAVSTAKSVQPKKTP